MDNIFIQSLVRLKKAKICILVFLSILLICSSTFADEEKDFGDIRLIKSQSYNFNKETLEKFPFIQDVNSFSLINDDSISKENVSFGIYPFNISKEKKNMIILQIYSGATCGTMGCSTYIFEINKNATYKQVFDDIKTPYIFQISCSNKFSLVFLDADDKPYSLWEHRKGKFEYVDRYLELKDIPQCK